MNQIKLRAVIGVIILPTIKTDFCPNCPPFYPYPVGFNWLTITDINKLTLYHTIPTYKYLVKEAF